MAASCRIAGQASGLAQSSGSSSRASQVARRSTAVSNSGWVSVNSWSRSASQARVTSSSPRRFSSSSMPRSVKYIGLFLVSSGKRPRDQVLLLLGVPLDGADGGRGGLRTGDRHDLGVDVRPHVEGVVGPRTHVLRLVLHPADLLEVRVARDLVTDLRLGPRVELLDAADREALAVLA